MSFAMTKKPNLIFDAGGVLVFPNFELLAEIANRVGIETSAQEIAAQHAQLFRDFDEQVARHHQFPAIQYFLDLFKRVTPSIEKVQAALELTSEAEKEKHLWATTQPWVKEALRKLKGRGYKMAVISNSEGIVEKILQDLGLRKNFEIVIDSFVVGVEKPDSRIFEIALNRLGWDRSETIYFGDIFYVDVWGANQAGLGAIHLDKMGLYTDWDGIRIPSVKDLPEFLHQNNSNMQDLNLFPALEFEIN
jgi:HAD superfamily hydrolase (TIGR01549 family)